MDSFSEKSVFPASQNEGASGPECMSLGHNRKGLGTLRAMHCQENSVWEWFLTVLMA